MTVNAGKACREALTGRLSTQLPSPAHAGLVLHRYLEHHSSTGSSGGDEEQAKSVVLAAAIRSMGEVSELYSLAYFKYVRRLQACSSLDLVTTSPLVVGLGAATPLEVGLQVHHTFGVPVIPGSAIKGVASHYCQDVWGQDSRFAEGGSFFNVLFGSTSEAGAIVYHDAWIRPESLAGVLHRDVMTVHHAEYYGGKSTAAGGIAPPSDMDDPIPIPFLHVTGTFTFSLSTTDDSANGRKWAALAMDLISDALRDWGIGAKTRSGYGRFERVPGPARAGTGDGLRVRRVKDPKGEERQWFEALDGSGGGIITQGAVSIEIGDEVTLYVANRNSPRGYNFMTNPPRAKPRGNVQGKRRDGDRNWSR